jgi:2',3'-cyclic-nucleotide 2'-phosphodiesterase
MSDPTSLSTSAAAGRAAALLGTNTHVAACDTRIPPSGTASVNDVGITGPSGGMQGYDPAIFVRAMRSRLPLSGRSGLATGPIEWGAVLITTRGRLATGIERVRSPGDARGGTA